MENHNLHVTTPHVTYGTFIHACSLQRLTAHKSSVRTLRPGPFPGRWSDDFRLSFYALSPISLSARRRQRILSFIVNDYLPKLRAMMIGARIRQARERSGLSQTALAHKLGITRSACSQWEADEGTAPRRERLEQLAQLLGVSFEWLATGNAVMPADPGFGTAESSAHYHARLSSDQRELLTLYNQLKPEARAALVHLLRTL